MVGYLPTANKKPLVAFGLGSLPEYHTPQRLVYSSTLHSAKFTFDYVVCLKFIDVFDIISIWIGLIITDLP